MTDGPFRNSGLTLSWKRFGDDLVNDATSPEERVLRACDSMLGETDVKLISKLLEEIRLHSQNPQMELDTISLVNTLFDKYPKLLSIDSLQKHLIANLRDQMPFKKAAEKALQNAVSDWIRVTKNRLDEECICARDVGDMSYDDYRKGIERNREAFSGIDLTKLCEALISGKKQAFKQALKKKSGLDEGPDE